LRRRGHGLRAPQPASPEAATAIQANTVADTFSTEFAIPPWTTGLITTSLVAAVIVGGISRIGCVTGILAPLIVVVYVVGALVILAAHYDQILPAFGIIFREAFNPTASIAGAGTGIFLLTAMWGVKRGLFSDEAGQGSARIAWHEAPVEELFVDAGLTRPFPGVVPADRKLAVGADGATLSSLYGLAAESGAPLSMLAFQKGLPGEVQLPATANDHSRVSPDSKPSAKMWSTVTPGLANRKSISSSLSAWS
jgi:hypothetical protein